MRRFFIIPVVLCVIASIYCLSLSGCGEGSAADLVARPDVIVLDDVMLSGELERAPARFPHDLHTEAVKNSGKDCTVCHPAKEDSSLSLLFMRLEKAVDGDVKELYHDKCIGCHNENADAGAKTGPVACGDCHRVNSIYVSSRRPFGFDNSLHYRHIEAHKEKCESCHHGYDDEAKKLVYIEGQENPCRDCHRERTEDNRSSFRLAAHSACISCHREVALEQPTRNSGPQSCAGCHDQERQMAIAVVEQPPRLKRGQPDFVLLSAPEAELESSKLNTVPFSHIGHEGFTTTCRVCHHETLSRCSDCHSLWGNEKGGGVMLQQAMHDMMSDHSCVGCHQSQKSESECAGCHDLMERGRLSEHACNICHAGPPPENLEQARPLYSSLEQFRPQSTDVKLSFNADEIPDTVSIGVLAKQYDPVVMPHGKIVATLSEHVKNNKIATHFHGHEDVVCAGCHHHGSVGRKPALCENCHREPFNTSDLFRPGLNGAYHRQCLGCHVSMGLQDASKCNVCHQDAKKTTLGMAPPGTRRGSNR